MILTILIIFLVCMGILFVKDKQIILNPLFVYLLVWIPMILVYYLRPFESFNTLSEHTTILMLLSIFTFFIGYVLGLQVFYMSSNKIQPITESTYNLNRLQWSSEIIFLVVCAAFVLTMLKLGPPPLITNFANRSNYYVGYFEVFFLLIYSFWFITLYLCFQKKNVRRNVLLLFITLIICILKGNKFPLIIFTLFLVFFLAYNKKINIRVVGVIGLFIVIFFITSSLLYSSKQTDISIYKDLSLQNRMPERLHSLTDITLYYLNNLLNFNNYISQSHKLMGGLSTFGGVINAIHLDGLFTNKINLMDYTWASSLQFNWLTTGTYLKNGFIDYGNYGVITGPFVLSFFSTYFWKKAKLKRNAILSLYLFLLLWVEISLSFFTNYLTDNEILPNLIVIIVVITLCKNKEVRNV